MSGPAMREQSDTPWLQLTLAADEFTPERLEEALFEADALAVTLQDAGEHPILEPGPGETPLWPSTRVTGLFSPYTDTAVVKHKLQQVLCSEQLPALRQHSLEDRDWTRVWMNDFHPMGFGERLWVCPSHGAAPEASAIQLVMDPGLAFGTGNHPTTALCLEWLAHGDLAGKTVIDYGCGSGILAIAAIKLGATRVWAVDIDPQALGATRANAARNRVASKIATLSPEHLPSLQADILLANILAGPLIDLAPELSRLVNPEGHLVLSGLLSSQTHAVQAAFGKPFAFTQQQREDWVLLQAIRKR